MMDFKEEKTSKGLLLGEEVHKYRLFLSLSPSRFSKIAKTSPRFLLLIESDLGVQSEYQNERIRAHMKKCLSTGDYCNPVND